MLTAGIDAGMRFAKLCLVENGRIIASRCFEMDGNFRYNCKQILKDTLASLRKSQVTSNHLQRIVATGYGAALVQHAHSIIDEAICISAVIKNIHYTAGTVIDAGGLFLKIHNFDETGKVLRTVTNEKCAAGSGKFLEITADALNLSIDTIAEIDLSSAIHFHITSSCAVFAESEVISQIGMGKPAEDILAGVIRSLASKTASLLDNSNGIDPVAITGGLSAIKPFVDELKKKSGRDIKILPTDPRMASALGAALIGQTIQSGFSSGIIEWFTSRRWK